MYLLSLQFMVYFSVVYGIFYDSYRGTVINKEEVNRYNKLNATFWCTNDIEPCDPEEGRRIDGSCNNVDHPSIGAVHTPVHRLLPPVYGKGFEPKLTKSGKEMPLARRLRTQLLSEGRIPDQHFTHLMTHYLVFVLGDFISVHDTVNYVLWKPYCCSPKGKNDRECTPNKVPDDDPVFRFSDIRCLNMTRPASFQSSRCTKNDTVPERIVSATPLLDISHVYGNKISIQKARKFERGLLKYEVEDGKIWPPSKKNPISICLLNQRPRETRCHETGEDGVNSVLGNNLFSIWFWRHHNKIANELAALNPCWTDDELFDAAKDINIAVNAQIYLYEALPLLMGRENLIQDGVISLSPGFRDLYNVNVLPQISLEFPFILRHLHTMQEGALKMYDAKGAYLKQVPLVNLTLRTGFLALDNNLDYITQGSFRQASGKIDYVVDFDMTGMGLGPHQRANDILTNDMAKNRYFGFQPYVKYKQFCTGRSYDNFDSLIEVFDPERLEIIREAYEDVEDIDLLAGTWLEKLMDGTSVPPTFYCLVVEQLVRTVVSDRHWYERPNRPNAFTLEQLMEIRKASVSRFLCDVGDTVTHIQPEAFLRYGPQNHMQNCKKIPAMNLHAWADAKCVKK